MSEIVKIICPKCYEMSIPHRGRICKPCTLFQQRINLKKYREKNKEKVKVKRKIQSLKRKEKIAAYDKKRREKHREKLNAQARLWTKNNPEKVRANALKYKEKTKECAKNGEKKRAENILKNAKEKIRFLS